MPCWIPTPRAFAAPLEDCFMVIGVAITALARLTIKYNSTLAALRAVDRRHLEIKFVGLKFPLYQN